MLIIDASAEQIPPKPAQLILEVGLVAQQSGAVSLTDIVRLYESRLWIYSADRLHRKRNCAALVKQGASEELLIAAMRKPPSVQPAETRGRERLVNRRVAIDPRVSSGDRRCILDKLLAEGSVDQAGMCRSAAMVKEADDRLDLKAAKQLQTFIGPSP